VDELRIFIPLGIMGVQALGVRQYNQQICAEVARNERGEIIVIAQLDLVHGDGVILVDDGNDAELQQRAEGVAEVEVPLAVEERAMGQQYLRDRLSVRGEVMIVGAHEDVLADRGRRLEHLYVPRPLLEVELANARTDCARRDENNLFPTLFECNDLVGELLDLAASSR